MSVITLLTDFGTADYYAGMMKGVIKGIAPQAPIIDLSHNIMAQNIKQAAFILATTHKYFPESAIFTVIVDPGVGANRKAVCIHCANQYFVGPDNGFISYVLSNNSFKAAVELTNTKYFLPEVTNTFHGRDIFAPIAAHIYNGIELDEFGPSIEKSELIRLKKLKYVDDGEDVIRGEVLYIDSFGNMITSIKADTLQLSEDKQLYYDWAFSFPGYKINGLSNTFENASKNEFLAYIGSGGFLAIAQREANAAETVGAKIGMKVKAIKIKVRF